MVRTYRQRRKRKRNITIGSNGLPINVRNLPFTDELRIQCEILEFWYLNPHLSYRQFSGDLGIQNGAPHKVSRSSLRRLVKWFQCYGEPKCLTGKTLGRISGRKKMTSEQQLALKATWIKLELINCYCVRTVWASKSGLKVHVECWLCLLYPCICVRDGA